MTSQWESPDSETATFDLDARYPALAFLYAMSKPRLVGADGTEHPLRWRQNRVPVAVAGTEFSLYVRYFGLRVAKAEWSGPPPAKLEYRAPWIVLMRGELGVTARSRGAAFVLAACALCLLLPALVGYFAFRAVEQSLDETTATAGSQPPPSVEETTSALPTQDDREEAVQAASAAALAIASADSEEYAADVDAAAALMTDSYAVEFRANAEPLRATMEDAEVSAQADDLGSGLMGIDGNHASAVVFVRTTRTDAGEQDEDAFVSLSRAFVELAKVEGTWLIDGITPNEPRGEASEPDPDRAAVLDVAASFAAAARTIDYRTLDAHTEEVLALSAGSFRDVYAENLDELTDQLLERRHVSTVEMTAPAIEEYSPEKATALVTVDVNVTEGAGSGTTSNRQYLLRLDLAANAGEWRVNEMTTVS